MAGEVESGKIISAETTQLSCHIYTLLSLSSV